MKSLTISVLFLTLIAANSKVPTWCSHHIFRHPSYTSGCWHDSRNGPRKGKAGGRARDKTAYLLLPWVRFRVKVKRSFNFKGWLVLIGHFQERPRTDWWVVGVKNLWMRKLHSVPKEFVMTVYVLEWQSVTSQKLKFVNLWDLLRSSEQSWLKMYPCLILACWCKLSSRYYHSYSLITPYKSF